MYRLSSGCDLSFGAAFLVVGGKVNMVDLRSRTSALSEEQLYWYLYQLSLPQNFEIHSLLFSVCFTAVGTLIQIYQQDL
jgi:hypothetical protein